MRLGASSVKQPRGLCRQPPAAASQHQVHSPQAAGRAACPACMGSGAQSTWVQGQQECWRLHGMRGWACASSHDSLPERTPGWLRVQGDARRAPQQPAGGSTGAGQRERGRPAARAGNSLPDHPGAGGHTHRSRRPADLHPGRAGQALAEPSCLGSVGALVSTQRAVNRTVDVLRRELARAPRSSRRRWALSLQQAAG